MGSHVEQSSAPAAVSVQQPPTQAVAPAGACTFAATPVPQGAHAEALVAPTREDHEPAGQGVEGAALGSAQKKPAGEGTKQAAASPRNALVVRGPQLALSGLPSSHSSFSAELAAKTPAGTA